MQKLIPKKCSEFGVRTTHLYQNIQSNDKSDIMKKMESESAFCSKKLVQKGIWLPSLLFTWQSTQQPPFSLPFIIHGNDTFYQERNLHLSWHITWILMAKKKSKQNCHYKRQYIYIYISRKQKIINMPITWNCNIIKRYKLVY